MHRIFRVKAYEAEHGPHFNEEHARKAVSKMENEDGTRGPHWSIEETTTLANQYGVSLGNRFNRYDWFVALNMVYSDYYKVIINITCYCNLYIGSRIKHIGHRQAQFHINKLSRKIYDIKTQIAHKPKNHSNGCFL